LVAFTPEAWIAESGDVEARGRSGDHRFGKFFPDAKVVVLRDGEALCFAPGVDAIAQCGVGVADGRSYTV
jgi:hypothetical protein